MVFASIQHPHGQYFYLALPDLKLVLTPGKIMMMASE